VVETSREESCTRLSNEAADSHFCTHCAFVVQFRKTKKSFMGRAEHISSGRAVSFSNEQELLDFLKRVMDTMGDRKC